MCNITTCCIKNEIDKRIMTLCVEWNEDQVEILIMRLGELPLRGQISTAELVRVADNFNKSKDEYLSDVKEELSGENADIQFLLKDTVFRWKKKIWTRGKIICKTLTETIELSDLFMNIINQNSIDHKRIVNLEKENKKLLKKIGKMEIMMDKMTKKKNLIEEELCKRFLILLNSKKKRIRTLRDQLYEYTKNPVFDKSTDESDTESPDIKSQSPKRAKIDINANACNTLTKIDHPVCVEIPHPIDNGCDSDDSFELKLEPSQLYPNKISNFADEESEKDIFSS